MMRIRSFGLLLTGIFAAATALAQPAGKQVTHQQLVWFTYSNTLEFTPKSFLITEIHERRFMNPDRQHQFALRTHLGYRLGENWDASAGFTYFLQSPQDPQATNRLVIPELRPHVQFDYRQPMGRLLITHRYRAEKRFFRNTANEELAKGYNTNYRFRYRLGFEYRLTDINEKPLKLKVSDELHINTGKRITYNRFDQNRIYLGLNYAVLKRVSVEAGYLNWYQQRTAGDQFYNRHILSFALSHKIERKRKDMASEQ